MTMYQPGIPTGTVNLNIDYQNIQNNFSQLDTTYGTDHIAYSQASNNGYHTLIHMVANSVISGGGTNYPPTSPSPVGLTGELYTTQSNDGLNTDEILWYQSGAGRVLQLTSNIVPSAINNGYTFLPGGILLQWGQVTATNSSFTTQDFNIDFPNTCFGVFTQIYGSGTVASGNGNLDIRKSTVSNESFEWVMITSSSRYTGFYWWAIGN